MLPPRLGGPLALLDEGRGADVVVCGHVGLDGFEYISDIWKGGLPPRTVHPEYHALPFSFYDGIVRSKRWSKVRVVSEDRRDPMVQELVASYDAECNPPAKSKISTSYGRAPIWCYR